MNLVQVLILLVTGAAFIYLAQSLIGYKRGFQIRKLANSLRDKEDVKTPSQIKNSKVFQFIDIPSKIILAKKYDSNVTKSSMLFSFVIGVLVYVLVVFMYIKAFAVVLLPFCFIGGIIAINMKLHKYKKAYIEHLDDNISNYVFHVAMNIDVFRNINDTFRVTLEFLEGPIKDAVLDAYLKLQDGKSVQYALQDMNEKFPVKELQAFNKQLVQICETGNYENRALKESSHKLENMKVFKRKLLTKHRKNVKLWKTISLLTYSIPVTMMLILYDRYVLISNSQIMSIMYILAILFTYYVWRQIEKLEIYNPSNDSQAYKL